METVPLMDLFSRAEVIHFKTREASQNTDLAIGEFLGIDKSFQKMQVKLVNDTSKLREIDNYTSKLTEIDKRIKKIAKN